MSIFRIKEKRQDRRFKFDELIYSTIKPDMNSAVVSEMSASGLGLEYITLELEPARIEELIILASDRSIKLNRDQFEVVYDDEVKKKFKNGSKLRRAGIRFTEPVNELLEAVQEIPLSVRF